ncbi:metallophosphoesterase family protein [Polycladidibacter stylochi]|uniref:metallophosphoesterase family protein n=1 Tax=Polycladidibacter stylochi TaxID=1807766 RepID=UPI00083284BA|nr:metallophosphoesterase [Pseudovibrio stylochi]
MFTLAHFSDPHLAPLPPVKARQLFSKRVLGYLNWKRNRGRKLTTSYLEALIADMLAQKPEHLALTGDLVNIALPEEYITAKHWLQSIATGDMLTVVPGNHDAYVPGALAKATEHWAPYMRSDGQNQQTAPVFPLMRQRGPLAIIGLCSAKATAPFMASGHISKAQLTALPHYLQDAKARGLFRVVMLHHPPLKNATSIHKRLRHAEKLQEILARDGAELILHGHTHYDTQMSLQGPNGPIPVMCVPSASNGPGAHKPACGYNLYQVSGSASSSWQCQLIKRRYHTQSQAITTQEEIALNIPMG